jgi:hypothetical protein
LVRDPQPAYLSVQEAFTKARNDLASWVDLERNRRRVLAEGFKSIRQDPALRKFIETHRRYGNEIVQKLWDYLAFLVDNRRSYYQKLPRVR